MLATFLQLTTLSIHAKEATFERNVTTIFSVQWIYQLFIYTDMPKLKKEEFIVCFLISFKLSHFAGMFL